MTVHIDNGTTGTYLSLGSYPRDSQAVACHKEHEKLGLVKLQVSGSSCQGCLPLAIKGAERFEGFGYRWTMGVPVCRRGDSRTPDRPAAAPQRDGKEYTVRRTVP